MQNARRETSAFVCGLLALAAAGAAAAADEPQEWLGRMNEALTTRNYDGVFVLMHGGRVDTMRIIHRVKDGEVMERLVSLDGSGREFVRTGTELTCYMPDKKTVLVERRPPETTLLGTLPKFDEATGDFYRLEHVQRTRLMGRAARVIAVKPRDEFRYGYRLWIDEKTAMPLRTQLCDGGGKVIEQVQFASLVLPATIADSEFKPQVATEGFRWLRQKGEARQFSFAAAPAWRALRLPPGFRMTLRSAQSMPGVDGPVEHLVFSDGLASVSVFVETQSDGTKAISGPARVGSSSAFATSTNGKHVTAVGEVPPITVRTIANSMQADDAARSRDSSPPPADFATSGAPRR